MKVNDIFLHCSASPWGNALVIDSWHRNRGWSGIGYHYVILNGKPFSDMDTIDILDGQIETGRRLDDDPYFEPNEIGVHVAHYNRESVGICLIGKKHFTPRQLCSAKDLICDLIQRFGLGVEDVIGHYEADEENDPPKTCPNIPMDEFRDFLNHNIEVTDLELAIDNHIKKLYGET